MNNEKQLESEASSDSQMLGRIPEEPPMPPGSLSLEELNRRQELANKEANKVKVSHGPIKKIESVVGTDYICFTHADGATNLVQRRDLIVRAKSLLDALLAETASADPSIVEYEVWLCHESYKAVLQNAKECGIEYNPDNIKKFMRMLKQAETTWRDRHDLYKKRKLAGR